MEVRTTCFILLSHHPYHLKSVKIVFYFFSNIFEWNSHYIRLACEHTIAYAISNNGLLFLFLEIFPCTTHKNINLYQEKWKVHTRDSILWSGISWDLIQIFLISFSNNFLQIFCCVFVFKRINQCLFCSIERSRRCNAICEYDEFIPIRCHCLRLLPLDSYYLHNTLTMPQTQSMQCNAQSTIFYFQLKACKSEADTNSLLGTKIR